MIESTHAALAEEHEALLQFLYMAPVGLLRARSDGEVVLLNPVGAKLLLPLSGAMPVLNLYEVLAVHAPDLRQRVRAFEAAEGTVVQDLQLSIDAGHRGRPTAQLLNLTVLKLDGERLMAVISDVTESVLRDRQLKHTQAWLETIVNGLVDYALLELDADGRIRESNVGLERLTGHGTDVVGKPFTVFLPPEELNAFTLQDRLSEARSAGWSLDEGWRCRADGGRFWGSSLVAPLMDEADANPGYSLILRDISQTQPAREQLLDAVFCDHLTGLANRRCFHAKAQREIANWQRQPRPLSLLIIDADHFKTINDRHGHLVGDAVLRHLAAALSSELRGVDSLARYGGEEFVALLPGTDLLGAEALADRAVKAIAARPAMVDGKAIPCTVSIGVTTMSAKVATLAQLLQQADEALYAAKAAGRNLAVRWHPQHVRA